MAHEEEIGEQSGSLWLELVRESNLDQVGRLSHGIYGYSLMLAGFGLTTGYPVEHRELFWLATAAIVAALGMRVILLLLRGRVVALGTARLHRVLFLNIWLVSGSSGLLYVTVLWFYGFENWTFTILMIFIIGIATGSMVSFTPSFRLLWLTEVLLLGPVTLGGILLGTAKGVTFALAGLGLFAFLLTQGRRLNRKYWQILRDQEAKSHKARELEAANRAAEAASVAKGQFLARMSHEIRTPMHGILGLAQLAMAPETTFEQSHEYLRKLHGSAAGLLHVLNDILDFSKIEAGKLTVERTPFALEELVDETLETIRPQATAKRLLLTSSIDANVPRTLIGDPARLRQILVNLLGKGAKFTETGSVSLAISRAAPAAEGDWIELLFRVSDTGIGISDEDQPHIFEAFAQADGTITRRFGGTGLGLSICSQLVRLMGGRIWVESRPNVGSTFQFTCRLGIAREGMLVAAETVAKMPPVGPLRVLLAEDHPVSQLLAGKMLATQGHQVVTVGTGAAAVQAWQSGEFDVILMDNQMPEMGGHEATRRIRDCEHSAGRRRTAIIALTASALLTDREQFLAAGADDYLAKPFRADELHVAIGRVLRNSREPAAISRRTHERNAILC
jgi:signal transduction histidine kinase/FixJ family two-component response regulator